MSAGKVIGNVIVFGGIGAMAYLLLKKKPVVEQGATTKKFIDGIEESEYNKLKGKSFTELTEPLVDKNVLNVNYLQYDTWDVITRKYYTTTGDIKANTCLELDLLIKERTRALKIMYGSTLYTDTNGKRMIASAEKVKADAEAKFNKFNCRDKIEAERTKTLVDLQTKGSIKAEETIVNKGFTEQKTYIILGALVLLTGFYVVVKK